MEDIIMLRKKILNGKIKIDELMDYKDEIHTAYTKFTTNKLSFDKEVVENLIMICLDYYTYSELGDVLITDREYDTLMSYWIRHGGNLISRSDKIVNKTQWDFVKHESPGMVGTVSKIYSFNELVNYMNKYKNESRNRKYRIAPKFDGISSAIKINSDGRILMAVTRNDGFEGQDITQVVKNAKNAKEVAKYYSSKLKDGDYVWVKTELCVATSDFVVLIQEKEYKNRRSATSGIVNSPKNVHLAKYITIIPLASHNAKTDEVEYVPLDSKEVLISTPHGLMEEIESMLSRIRNATYEFRVDGVVIYPLGNDILPNYDDIMDDAVAYKINTEEGLTEIEFGYVSVGRLGYAVPMLRVKPVEVNETTVTDVSLGSFDKFANMDLHEGEQVIVYSAGDVIPQVKLPDERHYKAKADILKIKKRCPYCNEKLSRYMNTYKCENKDCIRVSAGRIANFVIKLKAENVSDKTIEDLVMNKLISDIPDLFDLKEDQIAVLPGYGKDSAKLIVKEIDKIRTREIPVSTLMGALGIQGISEKKCRKLFKVMPLNKMLKMKKDELKYQLLDADNTGMKTAEIFVNFLKDNKDLINELVNIMNVVTDIEWKGNVVFTGFRNADLEKKFNERGYEVSNNVNSKTVAVIDKSYNHESTKCKAAIKEGISVVHISEVDMVLKHL